MALRTLLQVPSVDDTVTSQSKSSSQKVQAQVQGPRKERVSMAITPGYNRRLDEAFGNGRTTLSHLVGHWSIDIFFNPINPGVTFVFHWIAGMCYL